MLNTASRLKSLGFGAETLGLEETEIDSFLEDALQEAGDRLTNWTGENYQKAHETDADADLKRRMTRAELLLVSLVLFYFTWSLQTTSENMITVEGIQVQMYNLSLDRQKETQSGLIKRAERIVEPYLIEKEFVSFVKV
jgi:hypothetical protein